MTPVPLQNRVTPQGQIIAHLARGALMGNRGILHGAGQTLGVARWRHKAWITCVLEFKGRHRKVMSPNRYTELFFLNEFVALAAGHRPCAECRRADFNAYRATLSPEKTLSAPEIDAMLHPARVTRDRKQVVHKAQIQNLPDGVFILRDAAPCLLRDGALYPYLPDGYAPPLTAPATGAVTVLTPEPNVRALSGGFRARA